MRFSPFSQSEHVRDDSMMFSAVYYFSHPRRTDNPTPSAPSTPHIREALNMDNQPTSSFTLICCLRQTLGLSHTCQVLTLGINRVYLRVASVATVSAHS